LTFHLLFGIISAEGVVGFQLLTEALPLAFAATFASGFFICFGDGDRRFYCEGSFYFHYHFIAFRLAFVLHGRLLSHPFRLCRLGCCPSDADRIAWGSPIVNPFFEKSFEQSPLIVKKHR